MPFNIFDTETKSLVELYPVEEGEPKALLTFETSEEAKRHIEIAAVDGRKLQMRKVAEALDPNWERREAQRITDGTYKRPSYLDDLEAKYTHFLHLAEKRPGMLAYTKDEEKGQRDLQTIISFEGYRQEFRSDMSRTEKARLLAEHTEMDAAEDGLQFARTPGAIEKVYTNYDSSVSAVASSCMRYETSEFPEEGSEGPYQHPCSVYGAGDLAIAYLTNASGKTIARALCWPEKKLYSRVYASGDRLHRLLQKRGYSKTAYYSDGKGRLTGARLLRVEHNDNSGVFVVPYCDDVSTACDDGEYLILDSDGGEVALRRTDGWSDDTMEPGCRCENCDSREEEDYIYTVYVSRRTSALWCEPCRDEHAFYCDDREEYYSTNAVRQYDMADGSTWSEYAYTDHGSECDRNGGYYHKNDLEEVILDEAGLTEMWGDDAVRDHAWTCERSARLYSDAVDSVEVHVGGVVQIWGPRRLEDFAFCSDYDGEWYDNSALVVLADDRQVAADHADEAREECTSVSLWPKPVYKPHKLRPLTLTGDDPGQLKFVFVVNPAGEADCINADVWQAARREPGSFKVGDFVEVTTRRHGTEQCGDRGYVAQVWQTPDWQTPDFQVQVRFAGEGAILSTQQELNRYLADDLALIRPAPLAAEVERDFATAA
jgi:hypothetical protein